MVTYALDVALGLLLTAAFGALAAAGAIGWLRHGDRVHAYLAWAAGLLATVCLAFRVDDLTASRLPLLVPIVVMAILGSGYALLMLRDALIPFRPYVKGLIRVALAVVALFVAVVGFPMRFEEGLGGSQAFALFLLSVTWTACVAEPVLRFWRRARNLSVVQRGRMRALCIGYGGLVGLLFGAGALMDEASQTPSLEAWILLAGVVFTGVLALAFFPPRWIRRLWRGHEERALVHAAGVDLFAATEAEVIAHRALGWAMRLVGAESGAFADPERRVLAFEGCGSAAAAALVERLPANGRPRVDVVDGRGSAEAIVLPVRLESGIATMIVVAGGFTPLFGEEETDLLCSFATTVGAALDRQRMDEIRATFLNAVSHELRTPLTAVLGLGHTLRRPDADRLPEEQRRSLLDSLVRNASRLDQLLSDLLDVDRLSRGVLEPRRRVVDISVLARRVIGQAAGSLAGRRVVVETDRPIAAAIDPPMLERIVENLIANAGKHTPEGSTIWVAVRADHGDLEIEVADDGPGVPSEMREAIFEPFSRGPNAPQHAPGSGIGLALVSRFAALHGGMVWVEDRPGGGASFRVRFPGAIALSEPAGAAAS